MEIIKILLVFATVIITIFTALLLDYGAKEHSLMSIIGIIIISVTLTINFIKFKIWGYIYKKYKLSDSYPIVAIFFPLIYLIAIYNGEANFSLNKIIGIVLILTGIFIMNKKRVNQ